jgi:quinol monooxygenase YgiN
MTMPRVTIVARVVARPDVVESVKAELLKLVGPTRQESGCVEYSLHQDIDNPALFLFYETWENPESIEKHLNSEHFRAYVAALDGLLEEKIVHRMTRIA